MKNPFKVLWQNFKDRLNKALEEMARENQQQFGNGRLDCCDLNKEHNAGAKK